MSKWQSIDTAPKGQYVLVWNGSCQAVAVLAPPVQFNPVAAALAGSDGECWKVVGSVFAIKPTHWMPLPKPPKE